MRRFLAGFLLLLAGVACADVPADRFDADIAQFVAADRIAPPAPGGIVFVGSSSIRLWESLERDFPFARIVKRGFGGSTLAEVTRYADRIVVPYAPALVVVYAGDNDLLEGRTAAGVFDDYVALVARIRRDRPGQKIAFIAIKPSPARAALLPAVRVANAAIRDYAARHDGLAFVDVYSPMLGADGQPRAALFGPDGLHLNADGYALWRRVLEPVLRKAAR